MSHHPCHRLPAAAVVAGGNGSAFVQFRRSTSSLSTAQMFSSPNNQSIDVDLNDMEVSQLISSFAFDETFIEKDQSSHNSVPQSSSATGSRHASLNPGGSFHTFSYPFN